MNSAEILLVVLLFIRCAAFVAAMPLYAARVPVSVRVGLAIYLLFFFYNTTQIPIQRGHLSIDSMISLTGLYLVVREIFFGTAMAVIFNLWLIPARLAAEFISFQIGLNAAALPGPASAEGGGVLVSLFESMAAIIFLILDGHHIVLHSLYSSFIHFPIGSFMFFYPHNTMIEYLEISYQNAINISAPISAMLFLLSITLSILSKAAPSLNIYNVGFTLQIIILMLSLIITIPDIINRYSYSINYLFHVSIFNAN